ncbi:hypothetical protein L226DRAFT_157542 [Lentinus tigrinus ALCF2SS1-7]|uniref:uncharacterized protein n=1 Tax=Lentinus tigrinus ALCF2SS1-7 TaxID=1328758 RepID=UPI00116605BE|nr:hypothetical protein L226DRAFT_157542 [Lentinus tigrinus ALCF2SS1-7]
MSSCIEAELLFFVRFWSLHTSKLVSNVAIIHHPCVMKTLLWLGCFGSSHHGPRPFVTNRRHAVNTNRGLRGDYRRSLRRAIPLPALQLCARLGYGVRARMVLFDSDYVLHVNTNVVQLYATGDHLHTRRRRSKRLVVAAHPSHPRKRCRSCNAGPWDPSRCCSPRRAELGQPCCDLRAREPTPSRIASSLVGDMVPPHCTGPLPRSHCFEPTLRLGSIPTVLLFSPSFSPFSSIWSILSSVLRLSSYCSFSPGPRITGASIPLSVDHSRACWRRRECGSLRAYRYIWNTGRKYATSPGRRSDHGAVMWGVWR